MCGFDRLDASLLELTLAVINHALRRTALRRYVPYFLPERSPPGGIRPLFAASMLMRSHFVPTRSWCIEIIFIKNSRRSHNVRKVRFSLVKTHFSDYFLCRCALCTTQLLWRNRVTEHQFSAYSYDSSGLYLQVTKTLLRKLKKVLDWWSWSLSDVPKRRQSDAAHVTPILTSSRPACRRSWFTPWIVIEILSHTSHNHRVVLLMDNTS
jgi:hypothetical protein